MTPSRSDLEARLAVIAGDLDTVPDHRLLHISVAVDRLAALLAAVAAPDPQPKETTP